MTSDVSERDRKVASCKSTTESRLPEVAAKLLSYVAASFSLALPRRQGQSRFESWQEEQEWQAVSLF